MAACVEAAAAPGSSAADAGPVRLPYKLAYHELPHWPTEMAINEIELRRSETSSGPVRANPGWQG